MARRGLVLLALFAGSLVLAGSASAASPIEREIQGLFWAITWFAIAVAIAVFAIMGWFLIRYREGVSPPRSEHLEGHRTVEIVWTVIPTVILVIITAISIPVLFFTDSTPAPDTVITVVSERFAWSFWYEDGSVTRGDLWFQEDVVVRFEVTSLDVIHSFSVPELGIKLDAIPGRTNHIWLRADEPGEYLVQCAEFCGVGHYGMRATVHVYAAGTQPKIYGPPAPAAAYTSVELREFGGNATHPWSIAPSTIERAVGSDVRLRIWNNNTLARVFRIDDPVNVSVQVPAFGSAWLNFSLTVTSVDPIPYGPAAPGDRSRGMVGALVIQAGRIVTILLDDAGAGPGHTWSVSPSLLEIDPGETVIFELRNVGSTVHNLVLGGVYEEVRCTTVIAPGETTLCGPFTFDMGEASGSYWCDVAGHRGLGMVASYAVGEPMFIEERALPLFEMGAIAAAVGTVALFAYLIHHARRRDD